MNLINYGFMPEMMSGNVNGIPARVTAVHKERYELVCEHGMVYARLKTKEYYGGFEEFPTTGDFVIINYIECGDSQIVATLPRKTFFSRKDPTPGRGEQVVAANFDYVFIMQSLNHDFNEKRLERYMTLAWQSGATPVVVLTKADLVTEYDEYVQAVEMTAPGVNVHVISSVIGVGLDELASYMELGCAIKAALESGELSEERWESYMRLKKEAKYSDDKGAYLREKQQWHKDIAKINRQKKLAKKMYKEGH